MAKTYLVNPNGYICQVMRVQGVPRVSCFRIYGNKKGAIFTKNEPITCKIGSACNSCLQVENSIKLGRYNGLYWYSIIFCQQITHIIIDYQQFYEHNLEK